MTDTTIPAMARHEELSLFEKTVTLVSWALAGVLFLKVGGSAFKPNDPLGAVSVFTNDRALVMLAQAGVLAGVASAVATLLAGRWLADVGTFAAALGLALVSLRGGTAESLLLTQPERVVGYERTLALKLVFEVGAWMLVVVVALVLAGYVMRWCFARSIPYPPSPDDQHTLPINLLAGFDLPRLGVSLFRIPPEWQTAPWTGLKHTLLATGIGVLAVRALSVGLSNRSIQHGQACFVAAGAVCIGCYVANRMVPVRSALWGLLSVPALGVIGFLWAAVRPAVEGLPPSVPSSHFLRILPIQYIAFGVLAALTMFWYHDPPESRHDGSRQT